MNNNEKSGRKPGGDDKDPDAKRARDKALDKALEESFPASDPVSPSTPAPTRE